MSGWQPDVHNQLTKKVKLKKAVNLILKFSFEKKNLYS